MLLCFIFPSFWLYMPQTLTGGVAELMAICEEAQKERPSLSLTRIIRGEGEAKHSCLMRDSNPDPACAEVGIANKHNVWAATYCL